MPTYDFDCTPCMFATELFLPITADLTDQRCPKCGKGLTQRIEVGLGFHLKGPDWPSQSFKKYEV